MRLVVAGLAATALAVAAAPAGAQTRDAGVVAGVTRSELNVSGDESLNVAIRHDQGFVAGLFVAGRPTRGPWWRIEATVTRAKTQIRPPAGSATARLTYLELPALVGLSGPGRPRVRISAGAYVAWLLAASADLSAGAPPVDVPLRDAMRGFDAGWIFGIGAGFDRVQLDLRYSGGLIDIARRPDLGGIVSTSGTDLKYRTRRFALVFSVPF